MKYVAMIHGNQAKRDPFPADAWPEAIARQDAFNKKYRDSGELLDAYGLADAANAQLVRRKDDAPAVTDGPHLETKEYIASFHLLDCHCPEPAQETAADMPFADTDPVDLRPVPHDTATDLRPDPRRRGPAARTGATGPRRPHPPLRRLRHLPGRHPGSTWPPPSSGPPKGRRTTPADGWSPSPPTGWWTRSAASRHAADARRGPPWPPRRPNS
ncbi:YciI family protein [Kitasatospora gansuensis]